MIFTFSKKICQERSTCRLQGTGKYFFVRNNSIKGRNVYCLISKFVYIYNYILCFIATQYRLNHKTTSELYNLVCTYILFWLQVWMDISGARKRKKKNQGYYKTLLQQELDEIVKNSISTGFSFIHLSIHPFLPSFLLTSIHPSILAYNY